MKMTIARVNYSKIFIAFFALTLLASCGTSYELHYESTFKGYSKEGVHSRGLFAEEKVVFVSGKDGHVSMHFLDTSANTLMNELQIDGVVDFRDIHYVSKGACIMVNSGGSGSIWAIAPGGVEQKLYDTAGVFLDGLDYWEANENDGIVYGDPINGKFFLLRTTDMGRTWEELKPDVMPNALENESGFAASGSGIQAVGDSAVFFGTGNGAEARLFRSYDQGKTWEAKSTPIKGGESYGIYSMYFWSQNEGIIVGGSYKDTTYNEKICYYTKDGGDSWENRSDGLLGYCSAIVGNPDGTVLVATGRMGTFYTLDKGKKWNLLTNEPYFSCSMTEKYIVLAGRNGTMEYMTYERVEK